MAAPATLSFGNITSTSILVQWGDVPEADRHGVILGYRVFFNVIGDGGNSVPANGTRNKSYMLVGLNEFTTYNICIRAFTSKGDGPNRCKNATTDEGREYLSNGNFYLCTLVTDHH